MTKFEEELKRPKKAYIDQFSKRDVDFTGVAKKFTEGAQTLKEWKEYAFLLEDKLKLQQQALPVVPECVAVQIERVKNSNGNFATLGLFDWNHETKPDYTKWIHENVSDFMRACTIGYTVEKPQLFYIALPKVYRLSDPIFVSKAESGIISEFTKGKDYALKLTEQEIKSIDERYWQFAVPVEDGE